jgi:hypothetical protein
MASFARVIALQISSNNNEILRCPDAMSPYELRLWNPPQAAHLLMFKGGRTAKR